MTERQIRQELESRRYNIALQTKVIQYLGCTISYKNPVGFGYFAVETPWGESFNHIQVNQYKSINEAKKAIKKIHDKLERS